ncbi:hypothetical protein JTB14_022139 [Gonioctena quinquepunctata]|nr:hypothetical protein JTB14_022139 [Gonioctena quinquepunctata]
MISTIFLSLSLVWIGVSSTPVQKTDGYTIDCLKCHPLDDKKINVHLVPHSHDDVGWLKTPDQYYYGMNTSIQRAGVQYILTSVVGALSENPDRRYIQVETAYFWKWWNDQDDTMRKQFKKLVDDGQIEMVNGAWSMNDEACSNYQSTIDQFTWGLKLLNETVGECGIPRVGWQIDPFGHSREQASLLSQMGYDAIFFARLDHDDKTQRKVRSALDFLWQGSTNLDSSTIFGSIFPTDLYQAPDGFCWDYGCSDDAIDDDPDSPDYNIKDKVDLFANLMKDSNFASTDNILIPMGGDFQYEAAEMNFINMDRFIRGFKDNTEFNVIYSTPSCYVKAVNEANPNLTLKTDDFFPYTSADHEVWAGYFTSRPNSKRFERIGHNILQATKQLWALSSFAPMCEAHHLMNLREIMGTMQHHDAITGTEKQHVASDYVRQLTRGIKTAEMHYAQITEELLNSTTSLNISLSSCLLSNISICSVSQGSDEFVVVAYNPLAWEVTHYVRLPVENTTYLIHGPDGEEVYDVVPTMSKFDFVKLEGATPAPYDLVFAAKDVPAMGMKLYQISKVSKELPKEPLGNSDSAFEIDPNTNLLKSVTLNGKTLGITQNFYYYETKDGKSNTSFISSGAYLFRPAKTSPELLKENVTVIRTVSGKLVEEVHQKWNDDNMDIVQSIRWYKDEDYVEFDWMVGNIDIKKNKIGKEIISKFTITDAFDSKNVFYTDSNGREMMKRTKDKRVDYVYDTKLEPVASNYYPVTSKIVIKDEAKDIEVAVLTDRSQGGSSLSKNGLELMIHRRLLHDDNKGVGESLNETEFGKGVYVRGSHYLVIGKASGQNPNGKSTAASARILAHKKLLQPLVGLGSTNVSFEDVKDISELSYSALETSLPENVNILTFEPWNDDTYLLRLEHIMENGEDSHLSDAVDIKKIQSIFKHFDLTDVQETTLAANVLLESYAKKAKYTWSTGNSTIKSDGGLGAQNTDSTTVSLKPMQIRSFLVKLGEKHHDTDFGVVNKPVLFLVLVLSILSATL